MAECKIFSEPRDCCCEQFKMSFQIDTINSDYTMSQWQLQIIRGSAQVPDILTISKLENFNSDFVNYYWHDSFAVSVTIQVPSHYQRNQSYIALYSLQCPKTIKFHQHLQTNSPHFRKSELTESILGIRWETNHRSTDSLKVFPTSINIYLRSPPTSQ